MKKISVIIPIYNIKLNYIERCIRSIVEQNYENYEILLIYNGCSKEYESVMKAHMWEEEWNIKSFYLLQPGVSNARNYGMTQAEGEYVVFVDGDDVIYPRYLQEAVEYIEQYDLDMVSGGFSYLYQNTKIDCVFKNDFEIFSGQKKRELLKLLLAGNVGDMQKRFGNYLFASPCAKIYKKSAISEIVFSEKLYKFEDLVFEYEVVSKVKRIGVTNHIWYGYYQYSNSAIRSRNQLNLLDNNYQVVSRIKQIGYSQSMASEYFFFCMTLIKDCYFNNFDLWKDKKQRSLYDKKMSETFMNDKDILKNINNKNPYYVFINKIFVWMFSKNKKHCLWSFTKLNYCFLQLFLRKNSDLLYER